MKIENNLSFNGHFETTETFNSTFLKTKLKVFAFGNNRNGSAFDMSSFSENAMNSMKLIPIVAKYNDETDDLEGHNVELKIKDNKIELFHDTAPIGVISNDSNITFEEVNEGTEESPDIKTYVVVDNVYLWKRYDATKRIESWLEGGIVPKISMEINSVVGSFNEDGYFKIDDFEFEAVAALGSDVEPCFPRAEIETYSKQSIKDEFKSMVYELSEALNQQGGNTEMTKEQKEKTEPEATPATSTLDMFTEAQFAEAIEMNLAFDANINPDNPTIDSDDTNPSDDTNFDANAEGSESTQINSETPTEFALTANQLREQLRIQIGKENHVDRWGDTCRSYWYVDHTNTTVIFENYQDGYQLYEATYTVNGDNVEVQTDASYKVKIEYVPFEGESVSFTANLERFNVLESQSTEAVSEAHAELNENFTTLQTEHETLKAQLSELQAYKRQTEESEIKAKFEGKLSDEEFTQVFSDMKDSELDKVEEKLFALIGKKNFSIESTQTNTNTNKVAIPSPKEVEHNPYGDIFN